MDGDEGISSVIKNANQGDEKRATYVYLMEKYSPKKHLFKGDKQAVSAIGFCVRFRLSQAYKDLEQQEIQASIPKIKPQRRLKIRIQQKTPGMQKIEEAGAGNPRAEGQSVPEVSAREDRRGSKSSGCLKLRRAVSKASTANNLRESVDSVNNSEREQNVDGCTVQTGTVVRFKSTSKEVLELSSQPLVVQKSVSSYNRVLSRRNSSTLMEKCPGTSNSNIETNDQSPERRKNYSVEVFEKLRRSQNRKGGGKEEPVSSKYYTSIMKRRFTTVEKGLTYNALLDNFTRNSRELDTVTGSISGLNTTSETIITGRSTETVGDVYTAAGSKVDSCRSGSRSRSRAASTRSKQHPKSASPVRPKTARSKNESGTESMKTKDRSKARCRQDKTKSGGEKTVEKSPASETKTGQPNETENPCTDLIDENEYEAAEEKLRLRPAKYLYHMCNCQRVARPSTLNKLVKVSKRKVAGVIEIYGCGGGTELPQGSVSTGFRSPGRPSSRPGTADNRNVVCPFCTDFPREKISAWMEDIGTTEERSWVGVR